MKPIAIIDAKRTPIGQMSGGLSSISAPHLAGAVIAKLLPSNIEPEQVNQVYMGCVLSAGMGQAPARQAAYHGGLGDSTPCVTLNKMCGSGMQAMIFAQDRLIAHPDEIIIAGGMENMSQAPYLLPKARAGYRLGHGELLDSMMRDGLEDVYNQFQPMGFFAEETAKKFQLSREAQDAFTINSYQKALKAQQDKLFDSEIIPIEIATRKGTHTIQQDEGPTAVPLDKLAKLKPVFQKEGTVTAGNSSSIADGASAMLMTSLENAERLGLPVMAILHTHQIHGAEPEWFTTAPIQAIEKCLAKLPWNKEDVDLFEINEAFAVVTQAAIHSLELDADKVNIHGGACALGHPIGATGARIVTTLIHALKNHGKQKGIAALCIGGGEATAVAIELNSAN